MAGLDNSENHVNPVRDFEKLGVFYLGRTKTNNDLLLYDSKDLVTHAVCVGMTGSGKTGLCITLLEEAAIDGIPAIIIDPKGDLPNLLLTFPDLTAQDFAPWVNEGDAQKQNLSIEDYAAQQAKLWKEGLAAWGQGGERIKRLRDAADFCIYTPGSNAGMPVSILKSFVAPPEAIRHDNELLAERINTTVTSLLALDRRRSRSDSQSRTHSAIEHSQSGVVRRKRSRHRNADSEGPVALDRKSRRDGSRLVLSTRRSI